MKNNITEDDESLNFFVDIIDFPNDVAVLNNYFENKYSVIEPNLIKGTYTCTIQLNWIKPKCNHSGDIVATIELFDYRTINNIKTISVKLSISEDKKEINSSMSHVPIISIKGYLVVSLLKIIENIKREELQYAIDHQCPELFIV